MVDLALVKDRNAFCADSRLYQHFPRTGSAAGTYNPSPFKKVDYARGMVVSHLHPLLQKRNRRTPRIYHNLPCSDELVLGYTVFPVV